MDTELSINVGAVEVALPVETPQHLPQAHANPPARGDNVKPPSLITRDLDELRFNAAALQQLHVSESTHVNKDEKPTTQTSTSLSSQLISSPYNVPGHYLDLTELDESCTIFAKALTALKPTRSDYATATYTDSLNFPAVLELIRDSATSEGLQWRSQSFYVVIFRSKLRPVVDAELLYKLDFESHREACESGGLLKYWFGVPDAQRRNLATCFWRSREDAHRGGIGPWHKKARAAGAALYEYIGFSTHRFTVMEGAREFRFEDWSD